MKKYLLLIVCLFFAEYVHGQWTKLIGPESSYGTGIVGTSNGIFLGTIGGLYASIDEGQTWQHVNVLRDEHISSIVSISDTIVITYNYTADQTGHYISYTLISYNAGVSWIDGDSLECLTSLKVYKHNSSMVAGTGDNAYFSSDYGLNWTQVVLPVGNFYSAQYYQSYFKITSEIIPDTSYFTYVSPIDSIDFDTVYWWRSSDIMMDSILYDINFNSTTNQNNLSNSTDFGFTWNQISSFTSSSFVSLYVFGDSLFYFTYTTPPNYFASSDGGFTWNPVNKPYHIEYSSMISLPNNDVLGIDPFSIQHYVMAIDSQYQSMNGLYDINSTLSDGGNSIYCQSYQGFYKSSDNGISWQLQSNDTSYKSWAKLTTLGDTIFGIARYPVRSFDGGQTWNLGTDSLGQFQNVTRKNNRVFVANFNKVWASDNFGDNWFAITNPPIIASPCNNPGGNFSSLITLRNNIYICSRLGAVYKLDSLDQNWTYLYCVPYNLPNNYEYFNICAAGNKLILFNEYRMFVSNDEGLTWIISGMNGLPIDDSGDPICPKSLVGSGSDIIGYSNEYGVYVSSDDGNNWSLLISGRIPFMPSSLIIHNNQLYSSSISQGIWTTNLILNLDSISSDKKNSLQIFPNPVCDLFQINIENNTNRNMKLSLFNDLGILVKEVSLEIKSSVISTYGLAKGIYIGRVTSEEKDFQKVFKILVQ